MYPHFTGSDSIFYCIGSVVLHFLPNLNKYQLQYCIPRVFPYGLNLLQITSQNLQGKVLVEEVLYNQSHWKSFFFLIPLST